MVSLILPGRDRSYSQNREQFLANLITILGDPAALWLPKPTDTTTSFDEAGHGITWTHDSSIASRLSALGLGYAVSFDGVGNYLNTPDYALATFGNGTTDSAVSWFAVVNVTDTALTRDIISKYDINNREWLFYVSTTDTLGMLTSDNSVTIDITRTSNAAITQGAWSTVCGTYAGGSGATAANNMVVSQNGVTLTSTAGNNASYVAMEDKAAEVCIGAHTAHSTGFFSGLMACVAVTPKNLSVSETRILHKLAKAYFNI